MFFYYNIFTKIYFPIYTFILSFFFISENEDEKKSNKLFQFNFFKRKMWKKISFIDFYSQIFLHFKFWFYHIKFFFKLRTDESFCAKKLNLKVYFLIIGFAPLFSFRLFLLDLFLISFFSICYYLNFFAKKIFYKVFNTLLKTYFFIFFAFL